MGGEWNRKVVCYKLCLELSYPVGRSGKEDFYGEVT